MCQRKLQILLFIIVLLRDWTILVTCNDDEPDRDFLTEVYNDFVSTGYEDTRTIMTDEELNALPADELEATVVNKMKEVECSFVYSSLYHLKVLRHLLKTRDTNFYIDRLESKIHHATPFFNNDNLLYKGSNPLCFDIESKSMLAIVYHWKYNMSMNVLWLSYVLHHALAKLNEAGLSNKLVYLNDDLTDVQDYLQIFTTLNCPSESKYNDKYERSNYYEYFKSLNHMSNNDKERLIFKNQADVNDMMKLRYSKIYDRIFLFERILLNRVAWKDHIIGVLLSQYASLDNSYRIQKKMLYDYMISANTASLRDRIKAIGFFQSKFINLLEIIMLQATWAHLKQLKNKMVSSTKPDGLISRITPKLLKDFDGFVFIRKLSKHLSQFVSYIGGSSHFNGVIDMLNKSISDEYHKYEIDENELNDQTNNVLTTLRRMRLSFYDCQLLFMKTENYTVKPKKFMKFLKKNLYDIDFRLIRSFIRFSEDFEKWSIEKDSLKGESLEQSTSKND